MSERLPDERLGVRILKHPHPFEAALTVCSDTHATPPETFEAVHALVNTTAVIAPGSDRWRRLFSDPEIARHPQWREGVRGFGLPIGDTMWLYDERIGVFSGFDEAKGRATPNTGGPHDFPRLIDGWLERGWVDSLHTPGQGPITREAAAAGMRWLSALPHRRLSVWVNHSLEKTPTNVEPDGPALKPVLRSLLSALRWLLWRAGLETLEERIPVARPPRSWPRGQGVYLWPLTALTAASPLWVSAPFLVESLRSPAAMLAALAGAAALVVLLGTLKVRYAQGDNPGSPHYLLDLAREAGFRYFWMIRRQPGFRTHVPGTLVAPETSCGGRPSILRPIRVDDGSRVLSFPRVWKPSPQGWRSLDLLTEEGLGTLCERQGTAIVYTHWTWYPEQAFTARALEGLERVRRLRDAERLWVAPTSEILRFTRTRAFLDFEVHERDGRLVIEIGSLRDPTNGPVPPTLEDLRGLSFSAPSGREVEVRLSGRALENVETVSGDDGQVLRFPLAAPTPTEAQPAP